MDNRTFSKLCKRQLASEDSIMSGKRHDYTAGCDDVLTNFKSVAERVGLSPLQVWSVYFNKHIDSIMTYVKTGKQESGEPMAGRIADARNYLLLLLALIEDSDNKLEMATDIADIFEGLIRNPKQDGLRPIITSGKQIAKLEGD